MKGCAVKHSRVRKLERGGKRGKGRLRERNKADRWEIYLHTSVHIYMCREEMRLSGTKTRDCIRISLSLSSLSVSLSSIDRLRDRERGPPAQTDTERSRKTTNHRPNPINGGWPGTLDVPVEFRRRGRPRLRLDRFLGLTCTHASTKVRQSRSTLLSLSLSLSLYFLYSMKKGVWERGSYLVRDDIRRSNCSGTPSRPLPFSLQIHPQLAIFHHNKTEIGLSL